MKDADPRSQLKNERNELLSLRDLSDVDQSIIAHLQDDGRRSFVNIAREIGVTEKTVRSRVRQLLESKTIQIVALTSPDALGYNAGGLLGVKLLPGTNMEMITKLLVDLPEVDYVVATFGRYDILVELISQTTESMRETIEQGLGSVAGIKSYDVFPYVKILYQQASFLSIPGSLAIEGGVRPSKFDDTDKQIIVELNRDGRVPLHEVSSALDISESQVRNRIKRMIDSKAMRVLAIFNPMNLRHKAVAWVAIRVKEGKTVRELAEQVSEIPEVSYIAICMGKYDVFAELVCASNDELLTVVDNSIRVLPNAGRVEAFPYLDLHYKRLNPASTPGA